MAKSYNDPIECAVNIHNPPEGVYPIGFKVYYTDKTVFTGLGTLEDLLGQWESLTGDGVQVIVIFESSVDGKGRNTRHMMQTYDYYSFDGVTFYGCNDTRAMNGKVIYGEWIEDDLFEEIRQYAFANHEISEWGWSEWH